MILLICCWVRIGTFCCQLSHTCRKWVLSFHVWLFSGLSMEQWWPHEQVRKCSPFSFLHNLKRIGVSSTSVFGSKTVGPRAFHCEELFVCESVTLLLVVLVVLLSSQHQDLSLGGFMLLGVCPLLGYQFVRIQLFIELAHNLYFCKIILISTILFLILVIWVFFFFSHRIKGFQFHSSFSKNQLLVLLIFCLSILCFIDLSWCLLVPSLGWLWIYFFFSFF